MRKIGVIILVFLALGCNKNKSKSESTLETDKTELINEIVDTVVIEEIAEEEIAEEAEKVQVSIDTVKFLSMNYPFIDSSEKLKFRKILSDTIDITGFKMWYLYDTLVQMNENEIIKYFPVDSLTEKIKEFYLEPYFYGLSKKRMDFYPVMIIYRWGEAAILSDYLLFNSEFQLQGLFSPSMIDMQPSYSISWYGNFINENVFRQYRLSRTDNPENSNIEYHDSSIYEFYIKPNGQIEEKLIESYQDTIFDEDKFTEIH